MSSAIAWSSASSHSGVKSVRVVLVRQPLSTAGWSAVAGLAPIQSAASPSCSYWARRKQATLWTAPSNAARTLGSLSSWRSWFLTPPCNNSGNPRGASGFSARRACAFFYRAWQDAEGATRHHVGGVRDRVHGSHGGAPAPQNSPVPCRGPHVLASA